MKRIRYYILFLLINLTTTVKGQTAQDFGPFSDFVSLFSDSTAFAVLHINKQPVLLVSHETFFDVDSLNQPTRMLAVSAQIYGLDNQKKIVCYGELRSQGTAYPLSMMRDNFLEAGHHFVRKFALSGQPISLYLTVDEEISYDTKGKSTETYENRQTNEYSTSADTKRFEMMMTDFEQAQPIVFSKISKD